MKAVIVPSISIITLCFVAKQRKYKEILDMLMELRTIYLAMAPKGWQQRCFELIVMISDQMYAVSIMEVYHPTRDIISIDASLSYVRYNISYWEAVWKEGSPIDIYRVKK